jgi:site-specific DNA-methyltransferase (adenine-specific)
MEINKIYNMDCLEGLKQLQENSIDCLITDPPYNIDLKPQRKKTKSIDNDNLTEKEFKIMLNNCFKEVNRVLKDDSFLIIFTGWPTIPLFRGVLDKYFNLKSMPIWVKNNFGIGYYTRPQYEPMFLYFKGNPKPLKKPISDVMKFNKILNPIHSCEKPLPLMRHLVKSFTNENDIILDCFAGSGSTLIASKELNRQFVGFEINKEYYIMCKNKLKKYNNKNINQWFNKEV